MRKALRLSPYCPDWYLAYLGDAYLGLGDLTQARVVYEHLVVRMPNSLMSQWRLAALYAQLENTSKAKKAVEAVLAINPQFSTQSFVVAFPYRSEKLREKVANDLRKAGLPE